MSLTRLVLGCLVTSVVMTWAIILLKIWQIVQARLANQAFRLAQSGDSHRCVAQRSALARLMTQDGAVEPGLAVASRYLLSDRRRQTLLCEALDVMVRSAGNGNDWRVD
jgi:biopolymer transport protein ExbB/TolQ